MSPMTSSPETRTYGTDPAQVYDALLPAAGAPEVGVTVVVVHGGFWRQAYDREHALPEARAFAAGCFHVALAEYRRAGLRRGGVPGTLDDVRDLLAAVAA